MLYYLHTHIHLYTYICIFSHFTPQPLWCNVIFPGDVLAIPPRFAIVRLSYNKELQDSEAECNLFFWRGPSNHKDHDGGWFYG